MTAGVPGVGIGGLFFLVSALAMPFVELGRTVVGRSSSARWKLVLRHFSMAAGIIAAFSVSAWALGVALGSHPDPEAARAAAPTPVTGVEHVVPDPFPVAPIVVGLGVLALLLVGATVANVAVGRRTKPDGSERAVGRVGVAAGRGIR